jgi:hypothetical protein
MIVANLREQNSYENHYYRRRPTAVLTLARHSDWSRLKSFILIFVSVPAKDKG